VVKPACRQIGNYPPDPFRACDQKGRELVAAGRHHREVYIKMCGEIFRFKSSFAYAANYCFSKAARSSQDEGLEAIVDSCVELNPADMAARWLCIEYQTTEVLRRAARLCLKTLDLVEMISYPFQNRCARKRFDYAERDYGQEI